MKPSILNPLHLVTFSLASASLAFADSSTWNGTTDAVWATTTNWSADPAPVPGTTNTATFNNAGGAVDVIDLGAGVTINSIVFDTATVAAYTIGSGAVGSQALTLEDSGSVIANSTINASQTFNANLTLGADASAQSYAFTNSDNSSSITFEGTITGGSGGTPGLKTININTSSSGGFLMKGLVSNGGATSLGIVKTGAGQLNLSTAAHTFSGGVAVEQGLLTISGSGSANNSTISLGAAGSTGSTVSVGVVNSTTNPASPLTIVDQTSGTATTRILRTNSSTSGQWSGAITMNDDLTVSTATAGNFNLQSGATVNLNSNTLTLANSSATTAVNVIAKGKISGNGNVVVNNTSTGTPAVGLVIIEGDDHDYTGTTTISAGTLQIGNGAAVGSIASTSSISNSGVLDYKRTGTLNQGGPISGTGPVRLISSGTVTFDKANTYSGATSIGNGGKLTVATGGSIAPTTGAALNVGFNSGAGTLQYDSAATSKFGDILVGNNTNNVGTLNQTNGTINATSLVLSNTFSGGNGIVTVGNDTGDSAAMNLTGNATVCVATSGAVSTLTVKNTGSLTIGGNLLLATSTTRPANGVFTQSGGTVSATALNLAGSINDTTARTHTSVYNLNGGTLTTGLITAGAVIGTPTTGSHIISATFNFNGGTLKPVASSATLWDVNTVVTANVKDGGAKIDTAGFDITISQPLLKFTGSTTDTLTKDGLGELTLAGTNTYTGATTVNAGTLGVTGSLDATAVEVKNDAALTGTGSLGGGVTVRTGGHLAFDVAASAGSQVPLTIAGSLTLEANTVIDLTAAAPPAPGGPYVLLTATGGISGSLGSFTFSGLSGSVVKNGNNLELTVTAPTGFAGWVSTPAFGLAASDKDPTDDPDNDGAENVLEYTLNGNPSTSDPSILPDLDVSGANFLFTFTRRVESANDTTQVFQYGTDLSGWTPLNITAPTAAEVTLATPSGGLQLVTVTIPKSLAGPSGKLFGRLQVVKIP